MPRTPMDERYLQLMVNYGWEQTDSCNCDGAHWKIFTNTKHTLAGVEVRIAPDTGWFRIHRGGAQTLEQKGYDILSQVIPKITV